MVARAQMTTAFRVVLDTNVVLSALLFKSGRVSHVFDLVTSGRVIPLVSKETAGELVRVLSYPKFALTTQEQRSVLKTFLQFAEVVVPGIVRKVPECRDPHDVPFLATAIKGKADYLVTGDRDLLEIEGPVMCPIITPERLLEIVSTGVVGG